MEIDLEKIELILKCEAGADPDEQRFCKDYKERSESQQQRYPHEDPRLCAFYCEKGNMCFVTRCFDYSKAHP